MGLGDFVTGIFGSKNKETAATPTVDPNAYQYGGHPGGADEAANRYQQTGQQAQSRQGAQAAFQNAQYGAADQDRAASMQARGVESQATNAMLQRALGKTPSIAQMQGDRQMRAAAAAQASAAASARGPGGLALAQQNAANNTANAQSDIAGQTAIAAANERLQAEQAAAGAGAQLRGGDFASGQMAAQRAQYDAGAQNQMSQYNTSNEMQQRGMNDAMQLGMTQAEMGVRGMQLGASQNQQAQQSANQLGAAGINAGVGGQNAAMNQQNAMAVVGAATNAAGAIGGRASGGPVRSGDSYVMGEKGPELVIEDIDKDPAVVGHDDAIDLDAPGAHVVGQNGPEIVVPKRDGVVIPAEQTAALLAPSTWGRGEQLTAEDQQLAVDQAGKRHEQTASAAQQADAYRDPYRQVLDRERAGRAAGLSQSPDDAREERYARYMVGRMRSDAGREPGTDEAEAAKEKKDVTEGNAVPKVTLTSRLAKVAKGASDAMSDAAHGVDVRYHGPGGGYVAPNLIPVSMPGRADGGPVSAGNPYQMGENGPEIVVPQAPSVDAPSFTSIGADAPSAPSAPAGPGPAAFKGNTNVQATMMPVNMRRHFMLSENRRIMAEQAGHPIPSGMPGFGTWGGDGKEPGHAALTPREDGGPVDKGRNYLMGEKGPEVVVPVMSDATAERMRQREGRDVGPSGTPTRAYDLPAPNTGLAEKPAAIVHASPIEPRPAAVLAEQGPDEQKLAMQRAAQTTSRVPMLMPLGAFLGSYFGASRR